MKPPIIILTCLGLIGGLHIANDSGLRLNFTDSAPIGLWSIKPLSHIERGTIAFMFPGGHKFLKPISAIEGDTVTIRFGHPVTVNGNELPNTTAQPGIQAWPDGTYTVKRGEVWVFSSYTNRSYDSRYFGPLGASTVEGEAIPLLVLGNPAKVTGTPL